MNRVLLQTSSEADMSDFATTLLENSVIKEKSIRSFTICLVCKDPCVSSLVFNLKPFSVNNSNFCTDCEICPNPHLLRADIRLSDDCPLPASTQSRY